MIKHKKDLKKFAQDDIDFHFAIKAFLKKLKVSKTNYF